jgi:hypothetical protein
MPESNPTAAPVTFQRAKARAPIGGTRYAGLSTLSGLAARAAVVAAESLQALGLGGGSVVTSRPPATPLTQQVRPAAPAVVRAEAPPPESGRALTSSFPAAAAVPDRAARPVVTPHESRPPEPGSAIASRVAVAVAAVVGTPPLVARSEPPQPEPGRTLQGWGPTAPLTPQVRPGTVVVARAEEPRPPAGGVATLPPPTEALTRQERPPAPVTASAEPPRPDPGAVRSSGVPLVPQPRGAMPVVAAEPGRPQPEAGTALSSSGKPEPLTPQVKPGTRVAAQAEPPRPGEGAVLWLKSPVNAPAGQGGRPGTVVRGDDPRPAEGVARYSSALPPPLTPQVKPPRPAVVPAAEPPPAPGQVLASRPAADSPAGLPRPGVVVALEFVPEGGRATWSVAPGGVGPAGPPPRPLVTPFEELPAGGVALWSRPAPPAAPDTLADLAACYRFDGDLTDSSDAGEDLAAGAPRPDVRLARRARPVPRRRPRDRRDGPARRGRRQRPAAGRGVLRPQPHGVGHHLRQRVVGRRLPGRPRRRRPGRLRGGTGVPLPRRHPVPRAGRRTDPRRLAARRVHPGRVGQLGPVRGRPAGRLGRDQPGRHDDRV